jgi:hypothetical protein
LSKPFDLDRTPFSVLDRRRTSLNRSLDDCSRAFTASRGDTITRRDIENGLVAVLHLDEIFDLLHRDITTEEILALLADVDFPRLRSVTLCDVALEEAVLPDDLPLYVEEADVKLNGNKWMVHKYDHDPFPSNPHAHNYAKNLKLHLGNGLLYSGKERVSCGQLDKKHLVTLRRLVHECNATIVLPELTI